MFVLEMGSRSEMLFCISLVKILLVVSVSI